MNLVKSAWALVQENRLAYLVVNIVYYGLVLIFMGVAALNQPLQTELLYTIGEAFTAGPLEAVGSAYTNAEALKAIGLTFVVNIFLGTFLVITLPSLIIPFSGLLMGAYRAILWGLLFSPFHPDMRLVMIPHSLTLLLEGQAYILALLGVYLQGRAFLWPRSVGVERRWQGYIEGLKRTGRIYILVILTLLVAAIYEVAEVFILAEILR